MDRRTFIGSAASGLVVVTVATMAQQSSRAALIGFLDASSPDPTRLHNLEAFQHGLRELGYVEGRNISFVLRWGLGDSSTLPGLARELVAELETLIADRRAFGERQFERRLAAQ